MGRRKPPRGRNSQSGRKGDASQQKSPACRASQYAIERLISEAEAFEALLELGDAAAAIDELLVAAGPGRMRLGVDFQVHRRTFRTPGRAGFVFGAVGHHHLDRVVVGMDVCLHNNLPRVPGSNCRKALRLWDRTRK
ncbi:hypothetical protein EMEDMD4_310128 [Sinorhizobium medicae]|uniref:Uncharacterized protein n=1 Tax=Sinorhizobium medicae TaxID=110321 RepID=A0A508X120_9HYPH|nr:hypothetical protein EMEDMD4_310128 [Sinorhizobium medicae]